MSLLQQGMLDAESDNRLKWFGSDHRVLDSILAKKFCAANPAPIAESDNRLKLFGSDHQILDTGLTQTATTYIDSDPASVAPSSDLPQTIPSPCTIFAAPTATDDTAATAPVCKKGSCIHGDRKSECRHCGGRAICEHGRRRRQCTTCRGSGICQHGKRKSRCKWCNGVGICEHQRLKSRCKECPFLGQKSHTDKVQKTSPLKALPPTSLTKLFMSLPDAVIASIAPHVGVKTPQQPRPMTQQHQASTLQPPADARPTAHDASPQGNSSKPVSGLHPAIPSNFDEASDFWPV
jgi:hypothetical protein